MNRSNAEIVQEYGPFPGADRVNGVTYDGQQVWFASGDKLNAFDPSSGNMQRSIDVAAHAGTAFDGRHLFQITEDRICKDKEEFHIARSYGIVKWQHQKLQSDGTYAPPDNVSLFNKVVSGQTQVITTCF